VLRTTHPMLRKACRRKPKIGHTLRESAVEMEMIHVRRNLTETLELAVTCGGLEVS
jgi:hypothetical protein